MSWIFKTESVVMPALLDTLTAPLTGGGIGGTAGGAAWVQGFLPLLNRAGQSVPPLLYADSLRDRPLKKWSVWATTLGMAGPFATLALLLGTLGERFAGSAAVAGFLALYALFFAATGLNQLGFSTLQAKLIPPHRRGRLIAAGGVLGSLAAVAVAYGFLAGWRVAGPGSFAAPFAATAAGMLLSSTLVLLVRETPDRPVAPSEPLAPVPPGGNRGGRRFSVRGQVRDAAAVLRTDARFRRIAAVACLFVTVQLVFPHYIVLARGRHGAGNLPLILYVAAQNVGAGLFSVAVGWVADRRGNRLAVRGCLAGLALLPPLALALTRLDDPRALAGLFFLLGLTPVTFKAVTNWTLELTAPENHPRYVSTLKLCMAAPFLLAVPAGASIDAVGHAPVFLGVSVLVAAGCGLTLLAPEPRRENGRAGAERG